MIENRTDWHEDESLFHGAVSRVMGTRLEALIVHSDTDMLPGLWRDMVSLLESMDRIFDAHEIDAVIHFASLKAVGESVIKPLEYYI